MTHPHALTLNVGFLLVVSLCTTSCALYDDPLPPRDRVHFPISIAVHPSGDYLYVVNTNFDTRYRQDLGGTVSVMNATTGRINGDASPYVASFGGIIRVNETGTKAYVPTRFKNTVTVFDIAPNGSSLFCMSGGEKSNKPTSCEVHSILAEREGKAPRIGESPYDIAVHTQFKSARISGIADQDTLLINRVDSSTTSLSGSLAEIATKANALNDIIATVDGSTLVLKPNKENAPGFFIIPQKNQSVSYDANDTIFVSSLQSPTVSSILLPGQNLNQLSMRNISMTTESGGIGKRPFSSDVLVVQQRGPSMSVFRPLFDRAVQHIDALFKVQELPLNHRTSTLLGRGIAFDPSGTYAYIISQNPHVLSVVRVVQRSATSASEIGAAREEYILEKTIPLKRSPSSIVFHPSPQGGQLYISCLESNSILSIDAASGAVTGEILLGKSPAFFTINEPRCRNNIANCVGYVTLFDDTPDGEDTCSTAAAGQCGSIGEIDLNPSSPRYHQLIRKFE